MHAYLNQHPQIFLPPVKEIHFFDTSYERGISWYKSHFPLKWSHPNTVCGEASPYYLFHPHVPNRVHRHCQDVKLIVLLRNPADRAYSHYMMQKFRKYDNIPTFEEAIEKEEERIGEEYDKLVSDPGYKSLKLQQHSYLARGKYFTQIKNWLQYLYPFYQPRLDNISAV